MTLDSALQYMLSALIHYFIIKTKYFTGTSGFATVWQYAWYNSYYFCWFQTLLLRIEVEVMFVPHYIHQDRAF